jgi:hypothetical protein
LYFAYSHANDRGDNLQIALRICKKYNFLGGALARAPIKLDPFAAEKINKFIILLI